MVSLIYENYLNNVSKEAMIVMSLDMLQKAKILLRPICWIKGFINLFLVPSNFTWISGHIFVEERNDDFRQDLKCVICGYISVGYKTE